MKFTIMGFSQKGLIDKNLNIDDAAVLRWFIDYLSTGKMAKRTEDEGVYYFVKYQAVIDEFPILGIKTADAMSKRLGKLVKAGILKKKVLKQGGIFPYFMVVSDEYQKLISNSPVQKSDTPDVNSDHPKFHPDDPNSHPEPSEIPSGTNNPSTNPSINPSTISKKNNGFFSFWEKYPNKKGKAKSEKIYPTLVKKIGEERINEALRNYLKEIDVKKIKPEFILHGSTFLNGRYEDYLNENFSIPGLGVEKRTEAYTWETLSEKARQQHGSKEKYVKMWEGIAERSGKPLAWKEGTWAK